VLEDFTSPKHKWVEMNDPVMGGKSTGTFQVDKANHVGVFHGSVEIVSFLKAPGFIKAETTKGESWPDASSCEGLRFTLRSSTPNYKGFRVSFGSKRPPDAFPYTYGFKSNMHLDDSKDFQTIRLPFDEFTDKWDAGTGDAVVTCAENKEYCPDQNDKKDLYSIALWGEGVEGKVDLEIQSISAYGCQSIDDETTNISSSSSSTDSIESEMELEEASSGGSDAITIEDFSAPEMNWKTMNDPVMGGRSKSSVEINDGVAQFRGTCAIVPFLHAPGFITMVTGGFFSRKETFPDVSNCRGLALTLRSSVDYEGYFVSFGTDRVPGGRHASGYKSHLALPNSDDFAEIEIPFSDFSSKWDEGTGKTTVTCQEDSQYCPTLDNLRNMKTLSFWGEGVEGDVALDVKRIGAYGCASGAVEAAASLRQEDSGIYINWPATMSILVVVVLAVLATKRHTSRDYPNYVQVYSHSNLEELEAKHIDALGDDIETVQSSFNDSSICELTSNDSFAADDVGKILVEAWDM